MNHIKKKKWNFGNNPNNRDYDPSLPIGWNQWDDEEPDEKNDNEEICEDKDEDNDNEIPNRE